MMLGRYKKKKAHFMNEWGLSSSPSHCYNDQNENKAFLSTCISVENITFFIAVIFKLRCVMSQFLLTQSGVNSIFIKLKYVNFTHHQIISTTNE